MKKVLILEDEENIRSFVVINLKRAGYHVVEASTGEEALRKLKRFSDINVALLDIMLPDIDGFEVCRRIRASGRQIGVIMLTARTQEMDKVTGLMTGADDYVTKPFSPVELVARIDALFRRLGGELSRDANTIRQGPFVLNTHTHILEKNNVPIRLTQMEFAVLQVLMQNPDRSMSREEILANVWGPNFEGDPKVVDVNVRRLRLKLEENTNEPSYITTVWGYGYKWSMD